MSGQRQKKRNLMTLMPAAAKEAEIALEERYGPPILNADGNPICGRDKKGTERRCTKSAGWGTVHSGYGPCKTHGGEGHSDLEVRDENSGSYNLVIKHQRLAELFRQEMKVADPDNLDKEITLIRSMIKLLAENFGAGDNIDFEAAIEGKLDGTFTTIRDEAIDIAKLVDNLSSTIRKKHEVLRMAGEMISRDVVRAYMLQIQLVLNNTLRNTCQHCRRTTNARDQCLAALQALGNL